MANARDASMACLADWHGNHPYAITRIISGAGYALILFSLRPKPKGAERREAHQQIPRLARRGARY
jgi:hypothetical protein